MQERYLGLVDRRLQVLRALAAGRAANLGFTPSNRALARRFLEPLESTWDDGDENLVRGFLDRWAASGADATRAQALSLLDAATALARMKVRPATLWFFLWEMESILPDLAPAGAPARAKRKGW